MTGVQTCALPIFLSTLRYFRNEYEAHVMERSCPAHACKALLSYFVTEKCIGCTRCARGCPASCIAGKPKERHVIDPARCVKCETCAAACPVGAIVKR